MALRMLRPLYRRVAIRSICPPISAILKIALSNGVERGQDVGPDTQEDCEVED